MESMIDLRSDTLTRPTAAMRAAIAAAEVGDEQRGEDPTVNALLARVCALTGKEAALFLPGGTMANIIAVAVHARTGDAVLAHRDAHLIRSESAGPVVLARVLVDALDGPDGHFTADDVTRRAAAGPSTSRAPHCCASSRPTTSRGGTIWPLDALREVDRRRAGRRHGHPHGRRAAPERRRRRRRLRPRSSARSSTRSGCASRRASAPRSARSWRATGPSSSARGRLKHMVGGALRQAGIAAAGCLYALDHHVERLADDHANARRLAKGLVDLGLDVHTPEPETNMVFFSADHGDFLGALDRRGVRIGPVGDRLRAVTHLDVDAAAIDRALTAIEDVLSSPPEGAHGERYEYG